MDKSQLARNLREARLARGISQAKAAQAVGKSRQTIVNWESPTETPEPSEGDLQVLANLYGVSPRDLRYGRITRVVGVSGIDASIVRTAKEGFADYELDVLRPRGPEAADLPQQLELMALDFEREALKAGADKAFMRYARARMRDPHLLAMFAGGYDEKPMSAEEQRVEFETVIEELRRLLRRRLDRLRTESRR